MPAGQYSYDNFVSGGVATPNATEGIICTTRTVSSAYAGSSFGLRFNGVFTAGAGTTSVRFRVHESSLSGTIVLDSGLLLITAGQIVQVAFECVDNFAGEVAGAFWVLGAAQTAGTAPGSFANGFSSVTVPV